MRYLKAIAQDRSGNGVADTILLHFYERSSNKPDELIHEAVAVDINADGVTDFQFVADTNAAGMGNVADKLLLKAFAQTFLKLRWFNTGENSKRVLVLVATQYSPEGVPNAVEMGFFDRLSPVRKPTLTFRAAGYDGDGNGVLESFTPTDVNNDGIANTADKELIRSMCNSFLAFKWYDEASTDVIEPQQRSGPARYLKVTAQDMSGNGRADTVILHFYQQVAGCPDELVHEIFAVDMSADRKVDLQWAEDLNPDSRPRMLEKHRVDTFADSFLKLNWFNKRSHWQRTLTMYVDRFGKTGGPDAIKLDFHERTAAQSKGSLVYAIAAYDDNSDGVLELLSKSGVDCNGIADSADPALIRTLCATFLAFEWHAAEVQCAI
ncbi:hypothetical protein [Pseudomonas sp. NS1(2017)]|uniref:hypothetical protein n=1 Tax=Pseudomonas sp. NS1(2017) TaxID=2025658 RepID=UPI0021149030|nr:hypothetical protein [Pseudomonas sp. NS1(2017)]